MKIHIKNMVCDRCKLVVRQILDEMSIQARQIELGEVELACSLDQIQAAELKHKLQLVGFEWLQDKKAKVIEHLQTAIIELVHAKDFMPHVNLQQYLVEKLHYDYNYLNNLLSASKGISIKQFLIQQKTERAKELIVYNELSFTQIADRLDYSNSAHFSSQFKKMTGLTPREFKQLNQIQRQSLDKVGKM